mmetsp:Transcript_117/g.156  ORF Transcript_117/g.156 Transcript_117/m.156 type:complete len:102 (-) Transcript_117:1363-1668(-)
MKNSCQGYLKYINGEWSFKPGQKISTPQSLIPLPNFTTNCHNLITERKLQSGFKTQKNMMSEMKIFIIAMHVSASTLVNQNAPSSLSNHQKLHPSDRKNLG